MARTSLTVRPMRPVNGPPTVLSWTPEKSMIPRIEISRKPTVVPMLARPSAPFNRSRPITNGRATHAANASPAVYRGLAMRVPGTSPRKMHAPVKNSRNPGRASPHSPVGQSTSLLRLGSPNSSCVPQMRYAAPSPMNLTAEDVEDAASPRPATACSLRGHLSTMDIVQARSGRAGMQLATAPTLARRDPACSFALAVGRCLRLALAPTGSLPAVVERLRELEPEPPFHAEVAPGHVVVEG